MKKEAVKLGVVTLGCPKNTADAEALLSQMPDNFMLSNPENSDLILLNTCAFLKIARDEVFETLKEFKKKKIILTGCLSGKLTKDIFKKYPQVFAVVSGKHYPEISEILSSTAKNKRVYAVSDEPLLFVDLHGKTLITPRSYAYVKIAEGCDNKCSFCLIPYLKGHFRSRPMISIFNEVKDLVSLKVKEIILVAQDCGYYGVDLYGKKMLAELLKKLSAIEGNFWIRVLYVYPERIDNELINLFAKNPKICKYLDIPLQHGDEEILKRMKRPFLVNKTLEKISKIREKIPNIAFRTSLIIGFPGESEKAFKNLLNFVEKIKFNHVGVFKYSQEENTEAYNLKLQISEKIKAQRYKKVMMLQQKISYQNNKKLTGKIYKTLIEKYDPKKNIYFGRTQYFAPDIDGEVIIKASNKLKLNEFYKVKINRTDVYDLYGEVLKN